MNLSFSVYLFHLAAVTNRYISGGLKEVTRIYSASSRGYKLEVIAFQKAVQCQPKKVTETLISVEQSQKASGNIAFA